MDDDEELYGGRVLHTPKDIVFQEFIALESSTSKTNSAESLLPENIPETGKIDEKLFLTRDYFEILSNMLIDIRKRRIEKRKEMHMFIKVVENMKQDFESKIHEKEEQLEKRKKLLDFSPTKKQQVLKSLARIDDELHRKKQRQTLYVNSSSHSSNKPSYLRSLQQQSSYNNLDDHKKSVAERDLKILDLERALARKRSVGEHSLKEITIKNQRIRIQEDLIKDVKKKLKMLELDKVTLDESNIRLSNDAKKLRDEFSDASEKVKNLLKQRERYKKKVEKWIMEKKTELKKKDNLIEQLTKKVIEMKQKIAMKNVQIRQEYTVERVLGDGRVKEIKMKIQKSGIEIKDKNKVMKIPISEVSRVYFGKETDEFFVKHHQDKLLTLLSPRREEIVQKINNSIQQMFM